MSNEDLARRFVKLYESKDIASISEMFDQQVVLRDWNRVTIGFEAAVAEFQGNFDAADQLKLTIKDLFVSDTGVAVSLEILVNNSEHLNVVDVIQFNALGKITSIIAFKGL